MTAAWHHLTSPWALLCLGLYAACVVVILAVNHGAHRKATKAAEHVNWLPFLPPVPAPVTPPFTQAIPDADWFDGMPVDVLSDDAVHSLFDRLVEIEGLES